MQEGDGGVKVSKALGEEVRGGGDRAAEVVERGHFLLEVKLERVQQEERVAMRLARVSGGSEGEKVVKGGGEGGGGEEVEVDGRSGLGVGGLGPQRGGRGVWRVETMALIPVVRPERRRGDRER